MKNLSLLKKIVLVLMLLVVSVGILTISVQETEALSITTTIQGDAIVVRDDNGVSLGVICGPGKSSCRMTYDFPDIKLTL